MVKVQRLFAKTNLKISVCITVKITIISERSDFLSGTLLHICCAPCSIACIDTLRQVVHRIPRRFLFIRWGTKALRQEIVSTNPHTRIVYAEYVKIER